MPHLLAERFVMREFAKAPSQWLPARLTPPGRERELVAPIVDLIGIAWNVPWERERTRRLLGMGFEAGERNRKVRMYLRGRPGSTLFTSSGQSPDEMEENDRQLRTHRRALLASLAIRLHQIEQGTVPAALSELVATRELSRIPLDPFDGHPFRYRVSAGEELTIPVIPTLPLLQSPTTLGNLSQNTLQGQKPQAIPRGQPVLWSVGPDQIDNGGRNIPTRFGVIGGGPDLVFLPPVIPMPNH
jgi:hypothetical protein